MKHSVIILLFLTLFSCAYDSNDRDFNRRSDVTPSYGNPYAPRYPQGQYQQYQSPYYYQQPASRYYGNPYATSPQYYNYYDADSYYVPPRSHYGVSDHNEGANVAVEDLNRHF